MAVNKKGLLANITSNYSPETGNLSAVLGNLESKIQIGRVKDIILNNNYPDIEKYGGESAIGTIFFEAQNKLSAKSLPAKPFYSQNSTFPLVNELVLLFQLPNSRIGKNRSEKSYYYMSMINLWNHPHHNAYPNPASSNALSSTTEESYSNSEKGISRNSKGGIPTLNLNSPTNLTQATFIERPNIHPLLPFAGDIIHQGRWGNSIRLGSTAQNGVPGEGNLNNWSDIGINGDPLTIIRNGQPQNTSNKGWEHITENIENDLSSIYLTSYQSIQLFPASENYRSFTTDKSKNSNVIPIPTSLFFNPQIILNSDRVVVNAKKDSILLSAQKSINLSTNDTVNINTNTLSIDAGDVRLGSKDAKEAVIKGNTLYFQLDQMLKVLIQMLGVLKTSQTFYNGVPQADTPKNNAYGNVETSLKNIREDLESILSKNVKTI